jgi:hypothetical protein
MKLGRGLVILGSALLLLLATLHTLDYGKDSGKVAKSNLPSNLAEGFRGLYLAFSAKLVILSILFVLLAWKPGGKTLLLLASMIPLAEFLVIAPFMGWFLGTQLLAAGTACLLVGALLLLSHA